MRPQPPIPRRHKQRRKPRSSTPATADASKSVLKKNGSGISAAVAAGPAKACAFSGNVTQLKLRVPDYSNVRISPSARHRAKFGASILDGPRNSSYRVGTVHTQPTRGNRPPNGTVTSGCRLPVAPPYELPTRFKLRRRNIGLSGLTVPMALNGSALPSAWVKPDCIDNVLCNGSLYGVVLEMVQQQHRHRHRRALRHIDKDWPVLRPVNASSTSASCPGDKDIDEVIFDFRLIPSRGNASNPPWTAWALLRRQRWQRPTLGPQVEQVGAGLNTSMQTYSRPSRAAKPTRSACETAAMIPSGPNQTLELPLYAMRRQRRRKRRQLSILQASNPTVSTESPCPTLSVSRNATRVARPAGLKMVKAPPARKMIKAAATEGFEPPHKGTPGNYWADRAYQLKPSQMTRQAAFDLVLAQPLHAREDKYQELGRRRHRRGAHSSDNSDHGHKTNAQKACAARKNRRSSTQLMQLLGTFQHVFNISVPPARCLLHRHMPDCTEVAVVPGFNVSMLAAPYTTQAMVRHQRRQRRQRRLMLLRRSTSTSRWLVPHTFNASVPARSLAVDPCSSSFSTSTGMSPTAFNDSELQGAFQKVWTTRALLRHQRRLRRQKLNNASMTFSMALEIPSQAAKRTRSGCGSALAAAPTGNQTNQTIDASTPVIQSIATRWIFRRTGFSRSVAGRAPLVCISSGSSEDPQVEQVSNNSANMLVTPCPPALQPALPPAASDAPNNIGPMLSPLMADLFASSPSMYSKALTVRSHPQKATKKPQISSAILSDHPCQPFCKPPPQRLDLAVRHRTTSLDELQRYPPCSLIIHSPEAGGELVEHRDVAFFFHRILATVSDRASADTTLLSLSLTLSLLATNESRQKLFEKITVTATPMPPGRKRRTGQEKTKEERMGRSRRTRQSTALAVSPTASIGDDNQHDNSCLTVSSGSSLIHRPDNLPIAELANNNVTPIRRPALTSLLTWVSTALEVVENRPSKPKSTSLMTRINVWPLANLADENDSRSGCRKLELEYLPTPLTKNSTVSPEDDVAITWSSKKVPALLEFVDWDEFAGAGALIPFSTSTAMCLGGAL